MVGGPGSLNDGASDRVLIALKAVLLSFSKAIVH